MRKFSVIAALSAAIDSETNLDKFVCSSCGTHTHSNLDEPHCLSCGSTELSKVAEEESSASTLQVSDDDLTAIHCTACDAYNILPTVEVSSLENHLHCVTCGAGLEIDEAEADNNGQAGEADDGEKEVLDGEEGVENAAQGDGGSAGAAGTSADQNVDLDKLVAQRVDTYGVGPEVVPQPRKESYDGSNGVELKADPNQNSPVPGVQDDRTNDTYLGGPGPDQKAMALYLNLSHLLEGQEVSMLVAGHKIMLLASDHTVAVLSKADAGANADIFEESRFLDAIDRVLEHDGLQVAISSFGFKPSMLTVPVPQVVKDLVDRQVSSVSEIITSKVADDDADMLQCLSIAAAGLNKGFFSDAQNHLFSGMVNEVSTVLSESDAQSMVADVFGTQADHYNKVLITKARELSAMPVEVRNSLAAAISNTRLNTGRSVDLGDRLEQGATPTNLGTVETSSVSSRAQVESKIVTLHKAAQTKGGLFGKRA